MLDQIVLGMTANAMYDLVKSVLTPASGDSAAPSACLKLLTQPPALDRDLTASMLLQREPSAEEKAYIKEILQRHQTRSVARQVVMSVIAGEQEIYQHQFISAFEQLIPMDGSMNASDASTVASGLVDWIIDYASTLLDTCDGALAKDGVSLRSLAVDHLMLSHARAMERLLGQLEARSRSDLNELARFELRLRDQIHARHELLTPPQLDGARKVEIYRLFVAPRLTARQKHLTDPISLECLTQRSAHAVVLGDPGGGKSTLATKLTYDLSSSETASEYGIGPLIPFLVILKDYGALKEAEGIAITDYLSRIIRSRYQMTPPDVFIDFMLASGRCFVIFDGLDELLDTTYRQEITRDVESFANLYPMVPLLVTSRRVGYDQAPLDERLFSVFDLAPFDESRVSDYVRRWFAVDDELSAEERDALSAGFDTESKIVPDLRSNPLMLALMCSIYKGEGYIPRNRPDVYDKCATMLFDKWDRRRGLRTTLRTESHFEYLLKYIAHWMYRATDAKLGATEDRIIDVAAEYLRTWLYPDPIEARAAATEFVEFCRGRAWVFTDVGTSAAGDRLYAFTHTTFLEFFTAGQIVRANESTDELLDVLIPRIKAAEWDMVAQLAVQICVRQREGAAEKIIARLLAEGEETESPEGAVVLDFTARCLQFIVPQPEATHGVAGTVVAAVRKIKPGALQGVMFAPREHVQPNTALAFPSLLRALPENRREIAKCLTEAIVNDISRSQSRRRNLLGVENLFLLPILTRLPHGAVEPDLELVDFWSDVMMRIVDEHRSRLSEVVLSNMSLSALALPKAIIGPEQFVAAHGWNSVLQNRPTPNWGITFWSLLNECFSEVLDGKRNRVPTWVVQLLELAADAMSGDELFKARSAKHSGVEQLIWHRRDTRRLWRTPPIPSRAQLGLLVLLSLVVGSERQMSGPEAIEKAMAERIVDAAGWSRGRLRSVEDLPFQLRPRDATAWRKWLLDARLGADVE